ncbi:MAG: hypothetical protein R2849_07325 [Thermomicrobiales bacterium]
MSDDSDDLEVASGFMSTALDDDEAEEDDVEMEVVGSEELVERVRRNLQQDAYQPAEPLCLGPVRHRRIVRLRSGQSR